MKSEKTRCRVFRLVREIERRFSGVIAWAQYWQNESGTNAHWCVCINDYNLYGSKEFKEFSSEWHKRMNPIPILFAYCNPLDKNLIEFAEREELIMDV